MGAGSRGHLPTALPCRSANTTSWRCAAACPPMLGCTAGSVAPRRPRSSPHRATTCAWSSSRTTQSPNVASGPTSSQVRRCGGQVTVLRGSQPLGTCPHSISITNYHQCNDLKQQECISPSSGGQESDLKVWAGPCPLKALGEGPSVPFPSL